MPCDYKECIAEGNDNREYTGMHGKESGRGRMLYNFWRRALQSEGRASSCPIGLCNIRKEAVGVASGTCMDENYDVYGVEPTTFLIPHSLRLLLLRSIYFSKLFETISGCERGIGPDGKDCDRDVLSAESSSVKDVSLHNYTRLFFSNIRMSCGSTCESCQLCPCDSMVLRSLITRHMRPMRLHGSNTALFKT